MPREARSITVYELQFIRWEGDELELEIHCSKGTYIRTITDDLGELLGCGAHVIYLRRLQVATYPIARMVTLEQLNALLAQAQEQDIAPGELLDPLLMPMDSPVENYPEVNLLPVVAGYVKQGQPVQVAGAPASGMVRITEGEERKFIGVGDIAEDGRVAPRRRWSSISTDGGALRHLAIALR